MVSNTGKGLQANLEGAAGRVMRNFSDIHEMLYQVPTCMYTICLPIKPASPGQGVSGALLLGFSAPPDMSSRRLAALAQLCTLLSQTLEDAAERMVCMVEQMIGAHDGCTCCMPEPAIPESAYDTRCRDDSSSSSGDDQGPQPPLLESIAEHPEEGICPGSPLAADSGLAAEAMATWSETPDRLLSLAEAEVSTSIHEPVKHGNGHPFLGGSSFGSPAPPFRFEKAIVVSVEKEDLVAVSPSGLSYARNDLEKEFTRWLHRRLAPIDALYATLVLMALCVMHSFVPGSGIAPTMRSLPLALPLAVPLVLGTFAKNFYHSEWQFSSALVRCLVLPRPGCLHMSEGSTLRGSCADFLPASFASFSCRAP